MQAAIFGCGNIGFTTALNLLDLDFIEKIYIFNHSFPPHLKELIETNRKALKLIDCCQIDAKNESNIEKAYTQVIKGNIDLLICAIGNSAAAESTANINQFINDFDSNYYSNVIPVIVAVKKNILNLNARIILVNSSSGHHAPKSLSAYASSKWALDNLFTSFRNQLISNSVKLDIINPTTIRNKYSKVFNTSYGIDPTIVAKTITKIIKNSRNNLSLSGRDYFVPYYYGLIRPIERIFPELLNYKFGLRSIIYRKRAYRKFTLKNGLITGAASGLGKELALKYSGILESIYLLDKNQEGLVDTKKEIELHTNCTVVTKCVDLNDLHEVKSLISDIPDVDLIINCAGIRDASFLTQSSTDNYIKTLNINYYCPVIIVSEFIKRNILPKKIINIISTTAIAGRKHQGIYSSSKAALWCFTRALRRTYGNKIQVIEVIPSTFRSNLFSNNNSKESSKLPTAKYVSETIFTKEKTGNEIIITPLKAKLYFLLDSIAPRLCRRLFP